MSLSEKNFFIKMTFVIKNESGNLQKLKKEWKIKYNKIKPFFVIGLVFYFDHLPFEKVTRY